MGDLERHARKRHNRRNIQRLVLAAVGTAGIIAVAMVAPNIFQAIPKLTGDRSKFAYKAKTAAGRLAQKGLVRFVAKNGVRHLELTQKGLRYLAIEKAKAGSMQGNRKRWDRRYRVVMFDIPEKRRATRERLRLLMHDFGFLRLQDSVWISPHDCEDLITLIKSELRIGKEVLYLIVDEIENDTWIKKHFHLPS
jgi:CRISPR-associated endonuclease Cas2